MSDIYCAKCEEPWDSYGVRHGDMTAGESKRFLLGEGCPCCHFGSQRTSCNGTGIAEAGNYRAKPDCPECRDSRKLLVRERMHVEYRLQYDYLPNVRTVPDDLARKPKLIGRRGEAKQALDCYFYEYFILCPFCMTKIGELKDPTKGDLCPDCKGDGKFHQRGDPDDALLKHAHSSCEGTDEDPAIILEGLGLL